MSLKLPETVVLVLRGTKQFGDRALHTLVERWAGMFVYDWVVSRLALRAIVVSRLIYAIFVHSRIENGPCQVSEDGQTTVLNPYRFVSRRCSVNSSYTHQIILDSWNNVSNSTYSTYTNIRLS